MPNNYTSKTVYRKNEHVSDMFWVTITIMMMIINDARCDWRDVTT